MRLLLPRRCLPEVKRLLLRFEQKELLPPRRCLPEVRSPERSPRSTRLRRLVCLVNRANTSCARLRRARRRSLITLEDMAKSAGERSVAGISAASRRDEIMKPSITQAADGTYYTAVYDPTSKSMTTAVLNGPDGKPLKGTRDLDARTKAMVEALLLGARGEIDPDARNKAVQDAIKLLEGTGGARTSGAQSAGTPLTSQYKEGDIVNLRGGGRGTVVNVDGKLMVKPL